MRSRACRALPILALCGFVAWPTGTLGQIAKRTVRLAILDDASENARVRYYRVLRDRLRHLGYAERENLVIERRYAGGDAQRLQPLARELVEAKPDVILVTSTQATHAAMKATSSIPIVFTGIGDPVARGIVKTLSRPGGNVTGLSIISEEVGAKWIELLREIVPHGKRFAYLTDTTNVGAVMVFESLREQARPLGITIEVFDGKPAALERSFDAIARQGFAGLMVGAAAAVFEGRGERIVQLAARHKIPAVYGRREYAEAGGLVSYAADFTLMYQRTADYIYRIAQGAKPADMPVERASSVRLVLNLKASRTLGIPIPDSVRHRADELID